ncbi:unnamed protein product [Lepidochelys kempii]
MYLKLTFIQNVMEISCAILETRDSQKFEFSYKLELLGYMLGVSGRPLCLSSPVCYKAILAIGHLSKLKPSLILEENCELLDQCLKSLFPLPPLEKMMKEEGETVKDALPIQVRDNNSPQAPSTVFLPSRHWVMAVTHGLPGKVMVSFPQPQHTLSVLSLTPSLLVSVTVRRVLESPWQANEDFAGGRTNHTLVPGNVSSE